MHINEIQLTNIGPYRGTNKFDFRTEKDKNVILIGGENGAGKTTLLNSIKLGLFGSYGYGYKTENNEYFRRVQNILNNHAKKMRENNFRIKLEFTLVDNFEKTDYVLYRYWKYVSGSLKESYDLIANGKHLSEYDKELFQTKLKEIMPPQLLDLCLFDGEEIAKIINEDLLSQYIKNLARVVFNLDLFESLEHDLEQYTNQTIDHNKMESSEQDLYDLNQREKELKTAKKSLISTLDHLRNKKDEIISEYQQLKHDFEVNGGLVKKEREEIIKEINNIENLRKQNLDRIRNFVSTLLPFYLTKDLLFQTRNQIADEESLQLYKQLNNKLSNESLKDILISISGKYNEEASLELKEKLLNLVKPAQEIDQIHGASFSESSLVENMYLHINNNSIQEIIDIIEENKVKLVELQQLKERLKINDTTNEFSKMLNRMEKLQEILHQLDEEIIQNEQELTRLKQDLDETTSSIVRIQNMIKESDKIKSSFIEAQKIITLSRRFSELQLQKKLQEVQIEASKMIKKILRKQNYIASIRINPETYDLTLLDSNKEQIEKTTLSAGEKQILMISIIWAIFKCSGRKVPFIFDTLLGRLDKTHKATVLNEFIPNCGRQAIILSTDTEIDEFHYNLLEDKIAKEYTLDFDVTNKETRIKNQYFSFKQMELSL
jgi:DNA sulfur modification protein DndD